MKKFLEMVNDGKTYIAFEIIGAVMSTLEKLDKPDKFIEDFKFNFMDSNLLESSHRYYVKQQSKTSGIYTERVINSERYKSLSVKEFEEAVIAMSYRHPVSVKEFEFIFKETEKFKSNKDLDSLAFTLWLDDIKQKYFTGRAALPSDDLYTFVKHTDGTVAFIPLEIWERNLNIPKDLVQLLMKPGTYSGQDFHNAYDVYKLRNIEDSVVEDFAFAFLKPRWIGIGFYQPILDKELKYIYNPNDTVAILRRDLRAKISEEKALELWTSYWKHNYSIPGNELLNLAEILKDSYLANSLFDDVTDAPMLEVFEDFLSTYRDGTRPIGKNVRYILQKDLRTSAYYLIRDTRITPRKEK